MNAVKETVTREPIQRDGLLVPYHTAERETTNTVRLSSDVILHIVWKTPIIRAQH